MPKRKIHIDGPQPRGVADTPHFNRARKEAAAAKTAAAATRHDADQVAVSLRENLRSTAAWAMEEPAAISTPSAPSQPPEKPWVDFYQPAVGATIVVLPNASIPPMDSPMQQASDTTADSTPRELPDAAVYAESLLKINVPVAAVLVEKRMPLERVVHIAPGTVLKFGKPCSQPIELEVGGRRIATGEAVTIGERFGLRITALHK